MSQPGKVLGVPGFDWNTSNQERSGYAALLGCQVDGHGANVIMKKIFAKSAPRALILQETVQN